MWYNSNLKNTCVSLLGIIKTARISRGFPKSSSTAAGRKEARMMIDFDTMSKFVQFVVALVTIAKFVMEVSQPLA